MAAAGYYTTLGPQRLGLVGASASSPAGAAAPPLSSSAGPAQTETAPPWHPDNPLFWFAGLLLVTLGLAAGSSSVRLGPLRASVGAGKDT